MFQFKDIDEYLTQTMKGKKLVRVGDIVLNEIIKEVHYSDGLIIVDSEISQTYIHNDDFVIVPVFNLHPHKFKLFTEIEFVGAGDLIEIEEFHNTVACGGFIDSDGFGVPATIDGLWEWQFASVSVLASLLHNPDVTHIMWYNK